jgi:hypothetical protein
MLTVQVEAKPRDYVATRDFALNWDDKKMKSVKVRSGELVNYDGNLAIYKDSKTLEEFKGPCHGLKSAIEAMGWLVPKNGKVTIKAEIEQPQAPRSDYDAKIGGSFDTFMAKEQAQVVVPKPNKYSVIKEEDIIVKNLSKPQVSEEKKSGKFEVIGDQVAVKEKLMVRSSTTAVRSSKMDMTVIAGDEGGSERTISLNRPQKDNTKATRKTFTVDETTPRNITEDLTIDEVKKMQGVIKVDDSQDAKIIGTVKQGAETKTVEGITFKKSVPRPEKPITATVSRGGNEPVVNIQDDGIVVGKIKPQKDPIETAEDKKKRVESAKRDRLAKAATTQAMLEKEKPVIKEASIEIPLPSSPKIAPTEKSEEECGTTEDPDDTATSDELIFDTVDVVTEKDKIASDPESTDYLSMLPDDWGDLHWVKKEKFIKALTDKGFLEFILSVETIKAVQNACTERLKELG